MALQGAGLQIPDARDRDRSKLIKRRKVTIACEQCRERKRKCDGVRPLCGSCARRQPPSKCVWSQERWRHIPALEALDARIKQLEASRPGTSETSASDSSLPLSQVNEGSVPSRTTMTTSHRRRPVQPGPWQEGAFPPARPQPEPHGYGEVDTARKADPHKLSIQSMLSTENNMEQASESSRVDAMGTTSAFIARSESTEHPGSAFFGPSSTSSFLGVVRLIIGRSSNVPGRTPPSQHTAESRSSNLCSATSSHVSPEQDLGWKYSSSVFELPPRGEADMLVANYFTWVYSLYPIIHRPYFNARYERLWQRPHMHASPITLEDILFHCMLNAILALGTQFHPELEPHSRVSKSELFFAHCQQLLTLDLFAHSDFMTVQCLLLMCYFLLSTDKPDYCWNLSGLALRMAQAIGLHIDSADDCSQTGSRRDQVDVELQRRVWGGCCLLDRSLSFLYGRPLMMYPHLTSQFVFPSLIDDEYLTRLPDPPGSQPEGIPSVMATWSHCLRLGEILGEIISTFYQGNQSSISTLGDIKLGRDFGNPSLFSRLKQGDFKDLFTLDARLHDWYEQLPAYLKISSNPDPGMPGDGGGGGGGYQSHWDYCFSSTSTSLGPSPATDGSSGPSPSGHYGEANIPKIRNFQREANVLKARWLHVRVFLSRPALLVILDRDQYAFTFGYNEDTYLSRSVLHLRMLSSLADLCVSAAQDLVDLVYNNCPSEHKLLHVWWYSVCYLHYCAIVILIALQCPSLHSSRPAPSLKESWNKCLHCLQGFTKYSEAARRSHKVLQLIYSQVIGEQYDRRRSSPGSTGNGNGNGTDAGPGPSRSQASTPFSTAKLGHDSAGDLSGFASASVSAVDPNSGAGVGAGVGVSDPFSQFDWLAGAGPGAGIRSDMNMPVMSEGDLWMGDPGDMSWLSVMPFVTDMNIGW